MLLSVPDPLILRAIVLSAVVSISAVELFAQNEKQLTSARLRMVQEEIIDAGVRDPRVIDAMRTTPRHLFVATSQRHLAYFDMALPIGNSQTISPPFIVASMTEAIEPQPHDKVLEVGTGSGYQAAVLSPLVEEVYSIEIVEPLGTKAANTLHRLKYDNVHTRVGDGFLGWPEHAPFDKILVTCSPEKIPPALNAQLKEGGRMVIPLGERYQQTLFLFRKVNGTLESEPLEPTFFVPMTGQAEALRVKKEDWGMPKLLNASFESTNESGRLTSWYYVRQGQVVANTETVDGQRSLQFHNQTPGRGAQALQAVGSDGQRIHALDVSLWVRTTDVRPGQTPKQLPRIEISFFDDRQAPSGIEVVGPWSGTSLWTKKRARVDVPPRARLAVVAVGMFGATGDFAVDGIHLDPVEEQ